LKKYLKKKISKFYGFTLLEVLAALMILSVALIPIIAWVPASIQAKLKVERKTIAIFLCQAKIEELRPGIINNFNADYQVDAAAFVAPYQNFRYSVTDNLNPDLKTISVKVWHIENTQDETVFYTQIAGR